LIFTTEKQIKDYGDKLPEDKKKNIEDALSKLKEAYQNEDLQSIDQHTETLNNAWQEASSEMYQAQQDAQGEQSGAEQGQEEASEQQQSQDTNEDVEDADYEEVNNNNSDKDKDNEKNQ
ncbi:MAG: molecular chaperone DnaK, partial [Bacteroidetes bacterium SW_10_40_5]